MNRLPNIITAGRLVLALFTFFALAAVPLLGAHLTEGQQYGLERWAFVAFVVAAVTDFVDGWLARKLDAVSVWGAILDPIGDKVLVCGVILGLIALGAELLVTCWGAFGLPNDPSFRGTATLTAHVILWLAALVTLITGAQYWEQARKALV
jgi:CDP-diacylglycerol--glycerol-3-phosphate 3-phosphatidyltransferase